MRNNHRTIMRTVVFTSLLVVGLAGYAMAQTPDGETPAEETVCDRLEGALFGLCNAYCEALDCDEHILAGTEIPRQCGRVLKNFEKKSGGVPPPCFPETCTSTFPQCDGRCPARTPVCFNTGPRSGCLCLQGVPACGSRLDPLCNGVCPPGSKCLSGRGTCGCGTPCPCGSTEDLLDLIGNQEACILAEEVPTGQQSLVEIIVGAGSIAKSTTLAGVCVFGGGTQFQTTDATATLCIENILATGLPICE